MASLCVFCLPGFSEFQPKLICQVGWYLRYSILASSTQGVPKVMARTWQGVAIVYPYSTHSVAILLPYFKVWLHYGISNASGWHLLAKGEGSAGGSWGFSDRKTPVLVERRPMEHLWRVKENGNFFPQPTVSFTKKAYFCRLCNTTPCPNLSNQAPSKPIWRKRATKISSSLKNTSSLSTCRPNTSASTNGPRNEEC